MVEPDLEEVDKTFRLLYGKFFKWRIIACWARASSFGGWPGCLMDCKDCFDCLACWWRMVVTEDLGILKWWAISSCVWLDVCNSKIAEIVSDEYSRLELLGLEGIIIFDVLVVEKFADEHFAIFCLPLGSRYTRFGLNPGQGKSWSGFVHLIAQRSFIYSPAHLLILMRWFNRLAFTREHPELAYCDLLIELDIFLTPLSLLIELKRPFIALDISFHLFSWPGIYIEVASRQADLLPA